MDLIGQKFGRLLVLRRVNNNKWRQSRWLCKCDCGLKIAVIGSDLKKGHTKSCGCLQKEITIKRSTKHSYSKRNKKNKTHQSWESMIKRCNNPNHKYYNLYGERGITVCKRWMKFENFLEDMGEVPPGYQIDRIDNDKGYYKENCRWVTPKQQARNKRNNLYRTYRGKTQLVIEWAEEYNISYSALKDRICRLGWPMEKALTTPIRKKK